MSYTSVGHRTRGLTTQSFGWLAKKHGLTENEVKDMDARYKHADLDRSGQLDRAELKQLLKVTIAGSMNDEHLDRYLTAQWHNVDRDNSNSVDFDEFLALYALLKSEGRIKQQPAAHAAAGASGSAVGATGVATGASGAGASGASGAAGAGASGASGAGAAGKTPAAGAGGKTAGAGASGKTAGSGATGSRRGLGLDRPKKTKTRNKNRTRKPRTFTPKAELTQQNYVTQEIVWSALRKNHAFLVRRDRVTFSSERGNLRNVHTRYSSGLVNNRTVDISGADGAINLRLNAPSARRRNQPARQFVNTKLVSDNRGVARQLKNQLNSYRSGLTTAALARMTRVKRSLSDQGVTKKTQRTRGRRQAQGTAASTDATTTAASTAATTTAQ